MTRKVKHIFLSALALAVGVANVGSAYARNAGVVRNVYRQIEKDYKELQSIEQQINSFSVRDAYCKRRPYLETKDAAFEALKEIYDRATRPTASYRGRRTSLKNLVLADGLGGALDSVSPGGEQAMREGTFFNKYDAAIEAIETAYGAKRQQIRDAATKSCAPAAPPQPAHAAGGGASAVPDPLSGIQTEIDFADISAPTSHPDKFCSQDEKDQLVYHLRELRYDAHQNAVKAGRLAQELSEKLGDLNARRDRAFRDADAAAKAGDRETLAAKTAEHKSLKAQAKAAQEKFPPLIKKAKADRDHWRAVVDAIDAEIEKVNAVPVVDCSPETPLTDPVSGTAFPGVYEHVDNISLQDYNKIDVNITKTCFQKVKDSFVMRASTELSHARYNLSEWEIRLNQIGGHHDLLSHDPKADAELVEKMRKARVEARKEVAKWKKIVAEAQAVKAKAEAIVVENCDGDGGKTEIGRLDPGFEGISSEIPTPNLQAYDLPTIPERICSYEELEALRARAAKAREVAAHNRREWGKRLTALGKLLFNGQPGSAYPVSPEYAAHLDAQRQYDYWNGQQDVAHKVYWDLMERESEDCTKSDKKVSLGNALEDARNGAPAFNGGQGSGFGGFPSERDCIIRNGGCFYPDPRKDWMYDRSGTQGGFTGREAEHALNRTLDGVEVKPKHDDYRQYPDNQPRTPAHDHSDGKPCPEHGITGGTMIEKTPNVDKTPVTPVPAPAPYPNVGMAPDASKGVETTPIDTSSEQEIKQVEVQTPANLDKRNVTLNIPAESTDGQMTALKGPPLVLNETARAGQNAGYTGGYASGDASGEWVQVKPPVLVITPAGGSAADLPTPAEQEQLERETGQN